VPGTESFVAATLAAKLQIAADEVNNVYCVSHSLLRIVERIKRHRA
jgi:hypothetical protein